MSLVSRQARRKSVGAICVCKSVMPLSVRPSAFITTRVSTVYGIYRSIFLLQDYDIAFGILRGAFHLSGFRFVTLVSSRSMRQTPLPSQSSTHSLALCAFALPRKTFSPTFNLASSPRMRSLPGRLEETEPGLKEYRNVCNCDCSFPFRKLEPTCTGSAIPCSGIVDDILARFGGGRASGHGSSRSLLLLPSSRRLFFG